jgi:hypothetical protein
VRHNQEEWDSLPCPICGYDLRTHIRSTTYRVTCPECGTVHRPKDIRLAIRKPYLAVGRFWFPLAFTPTPTLLLANWIVPMSAIWVALSLLAIVFGMGWYATRFRPSRRERVMVTLGLAIVIYVANAIVLAAVLIPLIVAGVVY